MQVKQIKTPCTLRLWHMLRLPTCTVQIFHRAGSWRTAPGAAVSTSAAAAVLSTAASSEVRHPLSAAAVHCNSATSTGGASDWRQCSTLQHGMLSETAV
jgi:hypothetical protein